ncbi:hypothetical protein FB451DRAFT_1307076 [Mycena latifolia]|nr:hypothetical protein FB451DRAFT_1307076 [Mycena latifolia]
MQFSSLALIFAVASVASASVIDTRDTTETTTVATKFGVTLEVTVTSAGGGLSASETDNSVTLKDENGTILVVVTKT